MKRSQLLYYDCVLYKYIVITIKEGYFITIMTIFHIRQLYQTQRDLIMIMIMFYTRIYFIL